MYVFKSTNLIIICYFLVAHDVKNFILKFCMFVSYIIDYV
jgi:hypothetical protein